MKRNDWILLTSVTGLALVLRLWGHAWGAPERLDLHPDEIDYVMKHALELMDRVVHVIDHPFDFDRNTLDPSFLNYPGFLIYLIAFTGAVLRKLGIVTEIWQSFVIGRCIVASFGAASVPVAYHLARALGAKEAGALLAAFWVALLPLHVWESHVAITDVPMSFWITAGLLASVRLSRAQRLRDYLFAGAALGLAVGSKYTAAMFVVSIVVAALLARAPLPVTLRKLASCAAVSVAACFLVTPYSFFRFEDLLDAMAFEHEHVSTGHFGFGIDGDGPQFRRWIYQVFAAWPFSLGLALYASAVAGTLWVLRSLDRRILVVLSSMALFFYVTGSWTFTPLRYQLPLLVVMVIFAGLWQGAWLESAKGWQRATALAVVVVTGIYTSVFTVQTTARFDDETRIEAGRWISNAAEPGASILLCGWRRYLGVPESEGQFDMTIGSERSVAKLVGDEPYDLIQITSLFYERYYRGGHDEYVKAYDRLRDPDGPFELVAKFESKFIHKRFYAMLDPMFGGYFVSPTLEFYRSKSLRELPS